MVFSQVSGNLSRTNTSTTATDAGAASSTSANDTESNTPSVSTKNNEISKDEYIASCQIYNYKNIARNPVDYKGKPCTFKGKVVQVSEGWTSNTLRVDVTKGEYSWTDTIWVDYKPENENESRILADDIIVLHGDINSIKSYKTVLGATISIPWVIAKYVEIQDGK
jgi:hypothetical protein